MLNSDQFGPICSAPACSASCTDWRRQSYVDMQLVLAAGAQLVHRHANRFPRNSVSDHRRQHVTCVPGGIEVVQRRRTAYPRALDPADRLCRYQEKMRAALPVREHREACRGGTAAGGVDADARRRVMRLQPVRQTLLLHDEA